MTRTGRILTEYTRRGADGLVALVSFINYLPLDSALRQEMEPRNEFGPWSTQAKTNYILADLYDAFVAAHSKKGHKPKPYPRPAEKKAIGADAVPASKFWDWWKGTK